MARIVLVYADYEEEAQKIAEKIGKNREHSYKVVRDDIDSSRADILTWKFRRVTVDGIHDIADSEFKDGKFINGAELFSRFLSGKAVQAIEEPFPD